MNQIFCFFTFRRWQKVEEEYFLDYERNTNHTDEHFLDDFEDDDDDELDREDILLPW